MNKCINGAKNLLDVQIYDNKIETYGVAFSEFQKVYFSTNENINGYLNLVDFNNKSNALTVMASGDHAFNLITKGILNIDTFDSNKLTEYYVLGLKRALVMKYNYVDYLKTMAMLIDNKTKFSDINDILFGLLSYMDEPYKKYWKTILDYNYKEQKKHKVNLNLIELLFINIRNVISSNNYLLSEENFNILKTNIGKANISFKCADAFNLEKSFKKEYDFILLSNILDYFYKFYGMGWTVKELDEYIKKISPIVKDEGIIFVNYIFRYYYEKDSRCHRLIMNTNIDKNDLEAYFVEKVPYFINDTGQKIGDGIIMKKIYKK